MNDICLPVCRLMKEMGFYQREIAECYGVSRDVIQYRLSSKCKREASLSNGNRSTIIGNRQNKEYVDSKYGFEYVAGTNKKYMHNGHIVINSSTLCVIQPHTKNTGKQYYRLYINKSNKKVEWSKNRVFSGESQVNRGCVIDKADFIAEKNREGLNDCEIARILNVDRSRVSKIRRSLGLKVNDSNAKRHEESLNVIPEKILKLNEDKFDIFERLGHLVFAIRCKECGFEFVSNLSFVNARKTCPKCEKSRIEKLRQLKTLEKNRILEERMSEVRICKECEKEFIVGSRLSAKYCSEECSRRSNNRKHGSSRRCRKRLTNENPTWRDLYNNGETTCYLCGGRVNPMDFKINSEGHFVAGEKYPSLDHVIPLAKGGMHCYSNTKIACFKCNTLKRDKDLSEFVEETEVI